MEEPNLGSKAATRQRWDRKINVQAIIREIQTENPRANEDRLIRLLAERMREDDDALIAGAEYAVHNALNSQRGYERQRDPVPATPAPRHVPSAREVEERKAEARERIEDIKAQILLFNLPMANGKLARYCTGEELEHMGGAWTRVGKKIGKRGVLGQKMTEEEVRKYF